MGNDTVMLRIALLESFTCLLERVDVLYAAVRQDKRLACWVSRTEQEQRHSLDMRAKIAGLYQALWYEDGQEGRETLTCPGIVGASTETLAAATACNSAKDAFKAAVLALKKLQKSQRSDAMADLHKRNQAVAVAMKRIGGARLNLKQAYRHIPLLSSCPSKIGFTWSKQGRTIQRTSVTEARRLLSRRRMLPQIQLELRRLQEIPDREVLARVRSVCPHLRANIVQPDNNGPLRRLMQAPLPILIPLRPGEALPEFVPIPPTPTGAPRLQRSDVRIEEMPFLPSIRVHRYKPRYRCA